MAITGIARAGSADQTGNLFGSWSVEVTTIIQNATFPALMTFTSDGSVLADEPPAPFETTGHGNWVRRGHGEVGYTFVALFGGDSGATDPELAFAAYRLLQGFDNRTLQAGRDLWRLSRRALAMPVVQQALVQQTVPDIISALGCTPEGQGFLAELQAYLETHGQRSDRLFELDAPAWLDDPAPVICTLREYMSQPDHDLEGELAAQAEERERLVAETRVRLQGHPRPVVEHFDFLLRAAQAGAFLGEEHDYWIDYCMTHWVRQVMLEFGRRFVAEGALDEVDDIFYLTFNEVRETVAESPWLDRRALVAGRRAEMAYFRTVDPPLALGAEPAATAAADDPVARADLRFWGAAPAPADQPNLAHLGLALEGRVGRPVDVECAQHDGKLYLLQCRVVTGL